MHYGLTGVVIYERLSKGLAHYSAFVKSIKDGSKWFYINDSQVHLRMQISHYIMYQVQYTPVGYTSEHCNCSSTAPIYAFL